MMPPTRSRDLDAELDADLEVSVVTEDADEEESSGHELSDDTDDTIPTRDSHINAKSQMSSSTPPSISSSKTRHGSLSPRPQQAMSASASPISFSSQSPSKLRAGELLALKDTSGTKLTSNASLAPLASPTGFKGTSSAALLLASPRESNVVPEPVWTVDGERRILQWATLKQLIHAYAHADAEHAPDTLALRHLALAHAHFVPSLALLDQLVKGFRRYAAPGISATTSAQVRVVNIVKTWIEIAQPSISEDSQCIALLNAFISELAPQLSAMLTNAITSYKAKLTSPCFHLLGSGDNDAHEGPPVSLEGTVDGNGASGMKLLDHDPLEVARQLCLIDHQFLAAIPLNELHKKRWTSSEGAPHIEAASMFANKLAYWLAEQILREEKTKSQLKAFIHIVTLVYLALNLKTVKSLRSMWGKLLPKKILSTLKKVEQVNSPLDNFGGYRAYTRSLRPPMVPCQEIVLKDLLYQTDGSPDFHDSHVGVLNLLKLDFLGKGISHLTVCQLPKYCLRRYAPVYAMLQQVVTMDKRDLLAKTASFSSQPLALQARAIATIKLKPEEAVEIRDAIDTDEGEGKKDSNADEVGLRNVRALETVHRADGVHPNPPSNPASTVVPVGDLTRHTRTQPGLESRDHSGHEKDGSSDDERAHSDEETLTKRIGDSIRDLFVSPRSPFKNRIRDKDKDKKDKPSSSSSPKTSPTKPKEGGKEKRVSDTARGVQVEGDTTSNKTSPPQRLAVPPMNVASSSPALMPSVHNTRAEVSTRPPTSLQSVPNQNEVSFPLPVEAGATLDGQAPIPWSSGSLPGSASFSPLVSRVASTILTSPRPIQTMSPRSSPANPASAQGSGRPMLSMESIERWAVVRKFEKRGGVKVRVPSSLEELLDLGGRELGMTVPAVRVREAATEALIKSVDAIEPGAILWLMTQDEENNFD